MVRERLLTPVALSLTSVLLAACGSSNSGLPSPDAAKAQLKQVFLTAVTNGSMPIPLGDAGATCLAAALVDHLGVPRLHELDLAQKLGGSLKLAPDDAGFLATKVITCAPNDGAVKFFESKFDEGIGRHATAAAKTCMHQAIGRQAWIDLLTAEYDGQGGPAKTTFRAKAKAAVLKCGLH